MRLSLRATFGLALLTLAFLLTLIHPAFAQDVYVDAGSWVDQFAPYITLALYIILLGVVLFVVSRLPLADGTKALIQSLVLKYAQEWGLQLINAAVQRVKDATHGKVIAVNVGNAVLASAVQGFVDQVPGFVIKFLGGRRIKEFAFKSGLSKRKPCTTSSIASASFENFPFFNTAAGPQAFGESVVSKTRGAG
jgi:hypothetical protein